MNEESSQNDEQITSQNDVEPEGNNEARQMPIFASSELDGTLPAVDLESEMEGHLYMEVYQQKGRRKEPTSLAEVAEGIFSFEDAQGIHYEPPRSLAAFKDYVRLGRGRTLDKLTELIFESTDPAWKNVTTRQSCFRQLAEYSRKFDWQGRLRKHLTQINAEALATAQKEALTHTKERIRLAQRAQILGRKILEAAQLDTLNVREARGMLRQGIDLAKLGLQEERAETGDVLMSIKPDKPISEMDDEELETWINSIMRVLQ